MGELRSALAEIWPPARVRVVTPRLELRVPTDVELGHIAAVAHDGIHEAESMPFASPWTDAPESQMREGLYKWHWSNRATWHGDDWRLLLAVFVDGEPIGAQDVFGKQFPLRSEVSSGSWLGRAWQGRRLGREMRDAMLHFAFEHLKARSAISEADTDNHASIAVSRGCGYQDDGITIKVRRRGELAPEGPSATARPTQRFRLTRERWLECRRDDIVVHGFDDAEVRAAFGVETSAD